MNKVLIVIMTLLISCKSPSQDKKTADQNNQEILQQALKVKDEEEFLKNFPKDFHAFKNTFGWNDSKNAPALLYKDSDKYIQYWFSLLNQPEFKKYEPGITSIAENGIWEADGVNYFQDQSLQYIKKNNKYDLINSLSNEKAQKVLGFLFDGPVFNDDPEFINHLNPEKQNIVKNIAGKNISSEKVRSSFQTYENNDRYSVISFDVNKDGVVDKIVSSKPYQGNDLFLFYGNKNGNYNLALETTNFSEDGGNIVKNIIPNNEGKGFTVATYFPDRGYYETEMSVVPESNSWFLKKITYKTMSGVSENAVKYVCEVNQNIDITKSGWTAKIKQIPNENDRDKKCRTEKQDLAQQKYLIQDPDGYTNLRMDKNTSSKILQKINSGENLTVLQASGDWYFVKTNAGKKGYVHKSRLKKE
ncbi:SH3 domain-containing protein [Chryseobacterium arachidis]|uniref:SH3 domain-containing protein n=1 Tax=Chryseobacterium arachidis TaxID=1416778 RepID=A0A1M4T124_9FLAO|nr:SH3 domain-containing protein [Chryseobacterium arachidis]SHE38173.1 SH3 domain-containing protein [Chryseobacterium arachidis]